MSLSINTAISDGTLDIVGRLIKSAFLQICQITCETRAGENTLGLYHRLTMYSCRARNFVSKGVSYNRTGMVYHYDIPAISMNGCLSLTSGVPMWLACDVRTRRDHHPTWKFESMPGPSLAAVFDNDGGGPRRPTPPGMLRFQLEMNSQITVYEDIVGPNGITYRHQLTLLQIDPVSALTTPTIDPPSGIEWRAQYKVYPVGESRYPIQVLYFHFTAKLPQRSPPPPVPAAQYQVGNRHLPLHPLPSS